MDYQSNNFVNFLNNFIRTETQLLLSLQPARLKGRLRRKRRRLQSRQARGHDELPAEAASCHDGKRKRNERRNRSNNRWNTKRHQKYQTQKGFHLLFAPPHPLLLLLLLLRAVAFRSRGTCESVFKHACARATPFWCICAATYMFYLCC